MDKIGLNGVPALCVLGSPYIRGLANPLGVSHHYTCVRSCSQFSNSRNRFCSFVCMVAVLSAAAARPRHSNVGASLRMIPIFVT